MAIVTETKKKFIDIDMNFGRHPLTNDVAKTIDVKAIIQSMRNLIMSREFDHPFHPEISSPVSTMLFDQLVPSEIAGKRREIEYLIANYEPRVTLETVDILPNYNARSVELIIKFRIVGLANTYTVNFNLDRLI